MLRLIEKDDGLFKESPWFAVNLKSEIVGINLFIRIGNELAVFLKSSVGDDSDTFMASAETLRK